jgi:adenylosuccinate synthase
MSKVLVVVGAQYGSEGKGVIVNHIARDYGVHVRVGGPNAGHSFYCDGKLYKMQSIPCGWTNPDANLVIGAGAVVSPEQFLQELEMIKQVDPNIESRIMIDGAATVLSKTEHEAEGGVDGELHKRIGSTGEGVGAARLGRLMRDPSKFRLVRDVPELRPWVKERTIDYILAWHRGGSSILLEGTQGSGLSLIHGPWPYCTTADTNAAQLCADVGISPRLVTDIMLVVRTYPIRVAGNSGPMFHELTWDEMSKRVGKPVLERTTVTKKVRRVSEWDAELFHRAVQLNQPNQIALTFADYLSSIDEGKTEWYDLSQKTKDFVSYLEEVAKCPVAFVGTGGEGWKVVDRNGPLKSAQSARDRTGVPA